MITAPEGVEITALLSMKYGYNIMDAARKLQETAAEQIEKMTAFNVNRFDVEIRGLK